MLQSSETETNGLIGQIEKQDENMKKKTENRTEWRKVNMAKGLPHGRKLRRRLPVSLSRFNKIAIPNNKFLMASGQGSHWLIESPTIFSSMCSPPLSNICQFFF